VLKTLKNSLKRFNLYFFAYICAYMCVFLSVYICGCKGSKLVSMKQSKNDAQNMGKCAIFGDFCKESGKI
jgi:hypothetical protein